MKTESSNSQSLVLTLQYLGKRFDNHGLSCDEAQDMAVFQKMLVKIAAFKAGGADAKKLDAASVKRDFYFGVGRTSLCSGEVEINVIYDPKDPPRSKESRNSGLESISCIEGAFETLMKVLQNPKGKGVSKCFKLIQADLKHFGKNLDDQERIRFVESKIYTNVDVFYDSETRKKISSCGNKNPERIAGLGRITGLKENGYMYIRSKDYGDFGCAAHPNKVKTAFDGNLGSEVEFVVEAILNERNRIEKVKNYHYIEFAPQKGNVEDEIESCMKLLNEFADLEAGWLNGEGEKPPLTTISEAKKFIGKTPDLAYKYLISPDPDGGVCLEFFDNGWEKYLDFTSEGIEVHFMDLADKFDSVERFFKEVDSDLVEFVSNRKLEGQ